MRDKEANTITYMTKDLSTSGASYTVPLPQDWVVKDDMDGWYNGGEDQDIFPGGLIFPASDSFVGSDAYKNFPVFPPKSTDGVFTTPAGNMTGQVKSEGMVPPFGGTPTTIQIATASSSTVGYLSEELPSYFAQYFSVLLFGIEEGGMSSDKKLKVQAMLHEFQNLVWKKGLLANMATCSAWTDPDPKDMPECKEDNAWFIDGGFTDGPSTALTLSSYQKANGIDGKVKLILTNENNLSNNMNNIIQYFETSWNGGISPGGFVWAPGAGDSPQAGPWQSQQIFEEYQDEETIMAALQPIEGTSLTMAVLNATTIDNPAFGVQAGQKVSVALLNINSEVPTFLVYDKIIKAYTPALVELVETIAGSQDLQDRLRAFLEPSIKEETTTVLDQSTSLGRKLSFHVGFCVLIFLRGIFSLLV
uniref:Uncharacterized protein n=1 Tax=Ditylum brightwellii TaxID=49249 RepID=A0A7S1ZKN1_9STRA